MAGMSSDRWQGMEVVRLTGGGVFLEQYED